MPQALCAGFRAHQPILDGVRPFLAALTIRSITSSAEKLFLSHCAPRAAH